MAEYIERGALMQFPIRRDHYDRKNGNKHFINGIETVLEYAEQLPTVDAVPVVRCRDCIHKGWVQEPCHGKSIDYCRVWDCTLRNLETNFCSYGERKDGAEC